MELASVCPGLTLNICFWEIVPKYYYTGTDILWYYTMCILDVNMLLKVVSHYDASALSMSVMGLQKKVWIGRWVGGVSFTPFFGIYFYF